SLPPGPGGACDHLHAPLGASWFAPATERRYAVPGPASRGRPAWRRPAPPEACRRGRLPERPTGADCKSAGIAYVGSNPSPATAEDLCDPKHRDIAGIARRVGTVYS